MAAAMSVDVDANFPQRGHGVIACRLPIHGAHAGGRVFVDDLKSGLKLAGPNISPDPGSPTAHYSAEDWERTLRHGVKPDGRPLMVMPSQDYARWTDADVGAVASYLRSLPPQSGGAAVIDPDGPAGPFFEVPIVPPLPEGLNFLP